jgi:hypothetical protein
VIAYHDRAAWSAALGTATSFQESFNGVSGDISFQASPYTTANFSLLQQGPGLTANLIDAPLFTTVGVNGSTYASLYVEGDSGLGVLLNPTFALRALGFMINPIGTGEGVALQLFVRGQQSPVILGPDPTRFGGGGHFFGWIATGGEEIQGVRFIGSNPDGTSVVGQLLNIDDVEGVFANNNPNPLPPTIPTAENPEPSTVLLLAGGVLALAGLRGRSRA